MPAVGRRWGDMTKPLVNIVIPTFNRASIIATAVQASLDQSYENAYVTVIDDGSIDSTRDQLTHYFDHPRFLYIRLAKNVGTAQAKNAAIAFTRYDAITFHDSDDRPHPDKVLVQTRALYNPDVEASPLLNWSLVNRRSGSKLAVAAAFTEHSLIRSDGTVFDVSRGLSLVDDFFPNLQMAAGPLGDWILVNSGLFRRNVFSDYGGFANSIEEDRELRNRIIMAGEIIWLVPRILLTKIESADSLTVDQGTSYQSAERHDDRTDVWERIANWQRTGIVPVQTVDISSIQLAEVSDPSRLTAPDLPLTKSSGFHAARELGRLGVAASPKDAAA